MLFLLVIKMIGGGGEKFCKSLKSTLSKAEEVRHWIGETQFSCQILSCFVLPCFYPFILRTITPWDKVPAKIAESNSLAVFNNNY